MRHLRSILYALVLAPCIWVLLAVGFTDDLSSRGREFFTAESVSGLLLLVFSGILFSILAAGPVSPAGPVLAGAVYLGVTIWAFNAPEAYAALWSPEVSKESFDLSRPGYGLAAVLAIPLLGTALSARRWARYEPPVLPIIGEIGRFRGAAKVIGTPVAAEQTTVIRTGVPADPTVAINLPADPTVAINLPGGGSDRTVAFNSVPAAAPHTNRAPAGRPQVAADNDRTIFVTQPQSPAAPKPAAPPSPRPAEPEPTTVLATGSGEPTVVSGSGLAAGDEPTVVSGMGLAQAKPTPASAPVSAARSATASASVAATPARPATASASVAAAPAKPGAASAPVAAKPASGSAPVSTPPAKPATPSAPVAATPAKPAAASAPVAAKPASGSASVSTPPAKPATADARVTAKPASGSASVSAPPAKPATPSAPVAAEPATVSATPAKPAATTVPVTATPAAKPAEPAAAKDEETVTTGEPADDRTQAMTDDDQDKTAPLSIPAKDAATKPADEPTQLVTPPSDETEPLKLPVEPAAVVPAQRRPPAIES
ncbi:hypothetical protein [Actinoplanes xinjiangensis]|uniref:Meckel syndrome type 1 protein n=1 Tax=Actinoplanes xinjiangensis TaxID=512350 RepID=A0A316F7W7_9ACTN|nr:hypothetical protein [Actinoplanes xinjiangensis]PWK40898.1 hypothetical protein BC793_118128 [Actinoplanes xinjiangensis]